MKSRRFNYPFIFPAPIPWWIEIHTQLPVCTYYFGPFDTEQEAKGFAVRLHGRSDSRECPNYVMSGEATSAKGPHNFGLGTGPEHQL